MDRHGNFLPHLLPVDPTLHWANPPGGNAGRDDPPSSRRTPGPYTGPVPIVTHVHGAQRPRRATATPRPGTCPTANNIPPGFATTGTFYDDFKPVVAARQPWEPGTAVFQYPNDQRADDALVPRPHAGHDPAQRVRRAGRLLPAPRRAERPGNRRASRPRAALGDPPGTTYYEIPLAIQDRSFNADGSLFYPDSRAVLRRLRRAVHPATATSRRSGTRSSSATPWWSTARPGRSWTSSRGATGSGS